MQESLQLKQLTDSNRWTFFMESTAAGLQLNLTLMCPDGSVHFQTKTVCTACNQNFTPLVQPEVDLLVKSIRDNPAGGKIILASDDTAIVLPIRDNLYVAARGCHCSDDRLKLTMPERTNVVRQLLSAFQAALNESQAGGKKATELSTLRRMNHIILSMFQDSKKSMEHAFDLILSALVILSGAEGSWLEYRRGTEHFLLIKGDQEAVRAYLAQQNGEAGTIDLCNSRLEGRLGVLTPSDSKQAASLLTMLMEECVIVFEIDYLFQVVRTQLKQVLGSLGSAILLVDQHGVITYVNQAAELLLGQQFIKLVGMKADFLEAPWTSFLIGKSHGKKIIKQMDTLGKGARQRWVDWQLYSLFDGEKPLGWLVVADDRTDYYRWQTTGHQAERLANTSTMVGTLAHELRNPLSAAKGLLQLISRKRDPEKVASYSNLIISELDRVTRLLNEFLLLGRAAEKPGEPVDLYAFLQELLPLLSGEAGGSRIDIIPDLETVPDVHADRGQLTQVVLNLMRNAVDAVGERGRIIMRLRNLENSVLFEVEDNGPGLPQEVLREIFRPFFTTKERGTGLGLAVSQAIIHNSGGRITASNVSGGGALFSVLLPAYSDTSHSGRADVVIAVNNEVLSFPAEYTLRTAGFKTVSATSVKELLPLAEKYCPAVMILERSELCAQAVEKILAVCPTVKIMAIGDTDSYQAIDNVIFVPKPINYAHLVSQVRDSVNPFE
jgi:nitrogen-specific signal transduction histidine kinase